ncbi:DUF3592 domain-containing protein [Streptomyces sp. NPDC086787]|uniref:DUF3592 domain-containing protein n=1 Tax=Streptomyces sp. NPDC086787 TaxID=3365759 RepID=UPI00380C7B1A
MEALTYVVPVFIIGIPLLMITGVSLMAFRAVGRSRRLRAAWSSGHTAEGRCLRTYTTTSGGGGDTSVTTTMHHVYEFTARDGYVIRFEEEDGPGTVLQGDHVTVYYHPDRPENATARPPARGRLNANLGCALAFFGVFVAGCVGFIVVALAMFFSQTADQLP